jgi:predicted CXXCH cytochrome family protein
VTATPPPASTWTLRLGAAAVVAAAIASACGPASPADDPSSPSKASSVVSSNVFRRDYAGSKTCATCHADIAAKWTASPMHRMTRKPGPGAPTTPFDGRTLRFKGDEATLETHHGRPHVRIRRGGGAPELFEVTKVIGGRYREDFAGVPVVEPGLAVPTPVARDEQILPVSSLLFAGGALRYKGYSVQIVERPQFPKHGGSWSTGCIFCHNTAPAFASLYDDLSTKPLTYQGSVSDDRQPEASRVRYRITDGDALADELRREIRFLGGAAGTGDDPQVLLERAVASTSKRFGEAQLVEVGIGCESCHNGAREHADDPTIAPSFAIRSRAFVAEPGGGTSSTAARTQNGVCARCHTVLFSRYEPTWEGGRRSREPGGSTINSGEARDFSLGGCASAMTCTTCHDPHGEDDRAALDRMGTPAGNGVCGTCHAHGRDDTSLARHTKHAPGSAGSACLACHMPQKNMGLDLEPTRYHRIGSPTDRERSERDRPLECALCHTEASVETVARWMGDLFGKRPATSALKTLYGDDLSVPVLDATLRRGLPHERAIAASRVAERGARAVPEILPVLSDEIVLVRHHAKHALERAAGVVLPVDVDTPDAALRARAWWEGRSSTPP